MSVKGESEQEVVRALMRRELAWPELLKLMREHKSPNRFEQMIAAVQESVEWKEQILLPLGENLFIVAKEGRAIVKTRAGAELCAWNENWKMKCRVRVRRTREELLQIYPEKHLTIDPELVELREFYCPVSGTLLDVDCVPPTYPVETDFTPDLATFYRDWLGKPLPVVL
ncbi:MAG TPA: acetone carboxylase subunit gamma [Candidatus Binataceae bacterium]|nr:acetone carboxylase subunit gamma [Candidatus Binataceae bacterium]